MNREERLQARLDDQRQREELEARIAVWSEGHGGLTPARKWHCARRLLPGRRCLVADMDRPSSPARREHCPGCQAPSAKFGCTFWDHPSLWLKNGKPFVFVLQPYSFSEEDESALRSWCESNGLTYRIRPREESWWCPNGTYLIEVFAA